MRFCHQVLGADFSHMERHEQVKALRSFVVDASYLGNEKYTEEMVGARLADFCSRYQSFSDKCLGVVQDSGLTVS